MKQSKRHLNGHASCHREEIRLQAQSGAPAKRDTSLKRLTSRRVFRPSIIVIYEKVETEYGFQILHSTNKIAFKIFPATSLDLPAESRPFHQKKKK